MKVTLDFDAFEPVRSHKTDAGLDLRASHGGVVPAHGAATFGTGVHVQLPPETAGMLMPRSGLMIKHNILTFGIIDESYRGEIRVQMFNLGDRDYIVKPGDRVTQMLVTPVLCEPIEIVNGLDYGIRGDAGFGSTGY